MQAHRRAREPSRTEPTQRSGNKKALPLALLCASGGGLKNGGDLLSRLAGSIIGADGLNGSVRDGKRWNPVAVTTVIPYRLLSHLHPLDVGQGAAVWGTYGHNRKDSRQRFPQAIVVYTRPAASGRYSCVSYVSVGIFPGLRCPLRETRRGGKLRAISSARLWRRRLYTCALSTSSSRTALMRMANLGAGFALRCFQRLSDPDLATRRCTWRHNRQTRGLSDTVLSY